MTLNRHTVKTGDAVRVNGHLATVRTVNRESGYTWLTCPQHGACGAWAETLTRATEAEAAILALGAGEPMAFMGIPVVTDYRLPRDTFLLVDDRYFGAEP